MHNDFTPVTPFEKVREFHKAFKQPLQTGGPSLEKIEDRIHLRMSLIAEEFLELVEAVYGVNSSQVMEDAWNDAVEKDENNRDLIETIDAIADLEYVVNGMSLEAQVNLDDVVAEVHRSNMSKLDDEGEPIMSDGVTPDVNDGKVKPKGKILKSPDFTLPNIPEVLDATSIDE